MIAPNSPSLPADFSAIARRIQDKVESYERYNFSQGRNDFLKAFFDLAQEFDLLEDFYRICVAVPLTMASIACDLYICREQDGALELVCSCDCGVLEEPEPAAYPVHVSESAYVEAGCFVVPVFSRHILKQDSIIVTASQLDLWNGLESAAPHGHVLGMFVVRGNDNLDENDRFFLGKYANRIGYNLDTRLIARQNVARLNFINTLVLDIEHNVIVPNMYFRHLFNQLNKRIAMLNQQRRRLEELSSPEEIPEACRQCARELHEIEQSLRNDYLEIVKHHAHMTLFIESLFRREHFEQGHLVLRPKRCFIEKEVIIPQLEHYAARLAAAKISVDRPMNMDKEEIPIMVDIGLLAQVYANLFSNAAKYTREITDYRGHRRKAVAYGRERVDNFPVPGQYGIKFNVFTTGPSMDPAEGNRLFLEGTRGEGDTDLPGSGHGLSFIRHVVEMHGGRVGYEATREGNNFYFILPLPPGDQSGELFPIHF
ncbi:MAG: HAMP domain-containing sensor histidine kinase [bacterium]|nr:HAMP domain-containing sensor histidine kinase [bacterium]